MSKLKLKVNLYIKDDGYEKEYPCIIFNGNIIPETPNELPFIRYDSVNFQFDYEPIYAKIQATK